MKFVAIILLTSLLGGCSLKEAFDNNFEAQTDITPFASSDKSGKRFGNKITVRIPLAEDKENGFGYVDLDELVAEILGKEAQLDRDSKDFFQRLRDGFVLSLGRLAMKAGIKNKFKISSHFDFSYLNQEVITSAKVKRVFFTTENCRVGEHDCDNAKNKKTNLTFIDKLFVNLTNYKDADGASYDQLLANKEGTGLVSLKNGEFKRAVQKSFSQSDLDVKQQIRNFTNTDDKIGVLDGDEHSINLVKFTNSVPVMNIRFENVLPTDRELNFSIPDDQQKTAIASYLESKPLKRFVQKTSKSKGNLYVKLKKNVTPEMLTNKINSDQSPTVASMVIFRLNSGYKEAKSYLTGPEFKDIVKEVSIIGKSLYVELTSVSKKNQFNRLTNANDNYIGTGMDIYSVDSCKYANCIDVDVADFNLVPILAVNPKLKLDTFFSIKTLGSVDFKYNGFIEVEVELDLPF